MQNISNVQVEILDTGHLISVEKAVEFNKLVNDFIEKHSTNYIAVRYCM